MMLYISSASERINSFPHECQAVVGLFTYYKVTEEQRNFYRLMIDSFESTTRDSSQCSKEKPILVQFVFGIPLNKSYDSIIAAEKLRHGDITILSCPENMNHGKSYFWFSHLQANTFQLNPKMAFKLDSDTFVHYDNFAKSIEPFINNGSSVYYGRKSQTFMTGMFYGFSMDVVSDFTRNVNIMRNISVVKGEDWQSARWADYVKDNLKKNVLYASNSKTFIDHPDAKKGWSVPFRDDIIAIHRMKTKESWNSTISYFFKGEQRNRLMNAFVFDKVG